MTHPPSLQLVIFDCDGVLVDSEHLASEVLSKVLQGYGAGLTPQDCRDQFTGLSLTRVAELVQHVHGVTVPADFKDRLREKDREVFEAELKAISGINDALDHIALPKCVASSGRMEKITHSLTLTELYSRFAPHLFSAEMVLNGKPAPDLFLYAAQQMNVKPANCLVIEDSVPGIQAAKSAGMTVFGFCGGSHCGPDHASKLLDHNADQVFHDMSELPRLISPYLSKT